MKIIFLILAIIFINKSIYSLELFETSFYDVNFISNEIEKDKITKLNDIKKESINQIFRKILDNKSYENVSLYLTEDLTNTFIKNIIINDEIIINDKYFSKIKINFDKSKIINFLRDKNISYVEFYPNQILLIIFEEDGINENLFTKNNSFYSFLNKISQNNSVFKIPNLDINDRYILQKEDIKNKNIKKIVMFSKKYSSNDIIIVHAKKNENIFNFDLLLYSNGNIQKKIINYPIDQKKEFFAMLEIESLDMWKKINQIQNNILNQINCRIEYFNILELKEIRENLKNISIIKSLVIKSFSYKKIEYDIYYYGNGEVLTKLFKLNKLSIKNEENICEIRLK